MALNFKSLPSFRSLLFLSKEETRKAELALAAATSLGLVLLILVVQRVADPSSTIDVAIEKTAPIVVFPDFAAIQDISVKKQQFFDYLQDYIIAENEHVGALRKQLLHYGEIVDSGVDLSELERDWVADLAVKYRLEGEFIGDKKVVDELIDRVDAIPVSIALAQAANESAWGTSRFTLEANNLFGQWCYEEGCGLVPKRRVSGATHEVKRFDSVQESVAAYFININSHHLYAYFREIRAQLRLQDEALNPMVLAFGLGRYSARGEHYVDEVQTIIEQNGLRRRDQG